MSEPIRITVGLFGNDSTRKTSLMIRYLKGFQEGYIPTIDDEFEKDTVIDGKSVRIRIIDTSGQDDFVEMKESFYRLCQAYIFVYSLTEPHTLIGAETVWREVLEANKTNQVKCILVGSRLEPHDNPCLSVVPDKDAEELAKKMNCQLMKASYYTAEGVTEIFEAAAKLHLATVAE